MLQHVSGREISKFSKSSGVFLSRMVNPSVGVEGLSGGGGRFEIRRKLKILKRIKNV